MSLERNVVVACCGADRRGLEIPFVDGSIGTLRGPVSGEGPATCGVVARTQELHRVGNDIDSLALRPVLRLPLAPLQPSVDRHRAALGEETSGILALRPPHGDVEEVGLVHPLPGALVLATRIASDPQL